MLKLLKRFFGLDYNESSAEKHSGVGYSGVAENNVEVVLEKKTAPVESTTEAVKKTRKPRAKKSS